MWLFDIFKRKKNDEIFSIPDNGKEELDLLELANERVSRLSKEFKPLSSTGKAEALLFFSHIIVSLPELSDVVIVGDMEEKYMLKLCDTIKPIFKRSNFYNFANDRVIFFERQYEKIKREKYYTPMFIYNAFYMNPGCDAPGYLKEFRESPTTLLMLQAKLYELEKYIRIKREKIYYNYHFRH